MSTAAVGPGIGPGPPGPLAPTIGAHHHAAGHGAHGVHGVPPHGHMHPASHAPSPTAMDKVRKKSAHWSDEDTETLIDVLLQHRDSGRTADNGFKPEVWDKAAALLENNANTGGEKTPDACKSRWQRLQRDYKFARQLLTSGYGFTWDTVKHKLHASDASWAAAEKEYGDTKKNKKIYLPCYSRLSLLCPPDAPIRPRPPPKARMPSSSSTLSESSGIVPLNLTPAHNGTGGALRSVGVADGTRVMAPTNGHGHGHGPQPPQHTGLQPSLSITETAQVWTGEGEDSIESVDATFGLPDPSQQFAMPHQKRRMQDYDPTMLGSASAPDNVRKRQRMAQPHGTPTPSSSSTTTQPLYRLPAEQPRASTVHQTPQTPSHNPPHHAYHTPQQPQKQVQHTPHPPPPPPAAQHQAQPHHQPPPPPHHHHHHQHQQAQPQPHLHQPNLLPQPQQHMMARPTTGPALAPQPINQQLSTPYHANSNAYTTRSPQYTPTMPDPALPSPVYQPVPVIGNGDAGVSLLRTPQTEERRDKVRAEARALAASASMPNMPNAHVRSLSGTTIEGHGLALSGVTPVQPLSMSPGVPFKSLATPTSNPIPVPKSSTSTGRSTPGPTTTPEFDAGQRRIEAVRRLQAEELSDDDLMILLPDFEANNAVVETYLGLHRDQLRHRWLAEKIMARRRAGDSSIHRREDDHFDSGM